MLNNVIDISHHKTAVGIQDVKDKGIGRVFPKATKERAGLDAKYYGRRQSVIAAGLPKGAFHFGTIGNVDEPVERFLDVKNPTNTDPLVLAFDPKRESAQEK